MAPATTVVDPPKIVQRPKKTSNTDGSVKDAPSTAAKPATKASANNERLKVVVRRLPPCMTEDEFKDAVKAWVNEDTMDWFNYVNGKVSEEYAVNLLRYSKT